MSIEDRLTDPQYQNWLKGGQALLIVLNGLRQFADKTINDYHDHLKTQLGPTKCPQQCKAKKDPGNCPVCGKWKQLMMQNHSKKQVFWKNVDPKLWPSGPWEMAKFYMPSGQKHNVPITADDLDSTHMLNLFNNCEEFHRYFSNKNLPGKVLNIRNQLMHSSKMTIEDDKLENAFDVLLEFLEDKTHLQNLPDVKAAVIEMIELQNMTFALIIGGKQATIPNQPSMTLETAKRIEETLIKDVMGDFEARLISLESLSNDATEQSGNENSNEKLSETIAEWQEFVNDNADLKMKFGKDLQGIKGRCDLLEQRVAEINVEVDVLGVRVDALESAPPSDSEGAPDDTEPSDFDPFKEPSGVDPFMLKAITIIAPLALCLFAIGIGLLQHKSTYIAPSSGTKPAASYKNLLQEITANLKIDKPVYNCVHEEHGHRCTVTVDGTPYQTSKFCNSKKEAEQNVAELAYRIMKVKPKQSEQEKGKTADGTNYVGQLQEYQQSRSLPKPEYHPKTTENIKFTASVILELPGGSDRKFETQDVENSVREAKHAVAKLALRALQSKDQKQEQLKVEPEPAAVASPMGTADPDVTESSGTNYKGKLQERQQKLGLAAPTYTSIQDGKRFQSKVTIPVNKEGKVEELEGEMAEGGKKEAEHRAAKIALESLGGVDKSSASGVETLPKTSTDSNPMPHKAKPSADLNPVPDKEKMSTDSNPMPHKAKMSSDLNPMPDEEGECVSGANYKGKLQERQQKLGLAAPTYTTTQDGNNRFQSTVTVLVNKEDASQEFEGEMAEGGKKEAEHRAAKIALASLGGVDKSSALGVGTLPKTSTDSNPMPHKAKPSANLNPMPDNGDEQGECVSGANYKGKLQERQQKLGLAAPTYTTIQDSNKRFQSKVTVPVNKEGKVEEFEGEMAEVGKKDAEHRAAMTALASLDGAEDASSASVLPNTDSVCKASPKSDKTNDEQPQDSNTEPGTNCKGELQELLQSHGITNLPKYEDIEIQSAPGTYRSQVTLTTKYILQNNERHSSKKEAEKKTAELALKKLGIPGVDTHIANPKGKLQELSPSSKVFYETVEVGKSFHCTLISSILETENEVVVYADRDGRTKKERKEMQQVAARKVLDWLKKVQN